MPSLKRCTAVNTVTGAVTFVDVDVGGATGPPGQGVPVGGTAGQVLSKIDASNYNTQWSTPGAAVVADNAITNAKLADVLTQTIKGRNTTGTGDPEDLAPATVKIMLALTKADVGLGSVDNTADTAKPISTATQAALDTKGPLRQTVVSSAATAYTIVLTDENKLYAFSASTAITVTIPLNSVTAFVVGTRVDIVQTAAGKITVVGTAGVTVLATPSAMLRAVGSAASLIKIATDTWLVTGDLT